MKILTVSIIDNDTKNISSENLLNPLSNSAINTLNLSIKHKEKSIKTPLLRKL